MGRGPHWTTENELVLRHYMDLKLETSAIAKQTGWSVSKIYKARRKLDAGESLRTTRSRPRPKATDEKWRMRRNS